MSYIDKISVGGVAHDIQDTKTKKQVNDIQNDLDNFGIELNEIDNRIESVEETIGDNLLATTSQTLKGAINELKFAIDEDGDDVISVVQGPTGVMGGRTIGSGYITLEPGECKDVQFSDNLCSAFIEGKGGYSAYGGVKWAISTVERIEIGSTDGTDTSKILVGNVSVQPNSFIVRFRVCNFGDTTTTFGVGITLGIYLVNGRVAIQ